MAADRQAKSMSTESICVNELFVECELFPTISSATDAKKNLMQREDSSDEGVAPYI
jgi:hypothetical protein